MKRETHVQEIMAKLRVKDLDFQTNQITFINNGKITFLNLASDKMDVLKDLCVGKASDEYLFSKEKKKRRNRKELKFAGSSAYGDDVVNALKDVILNYF